MHAARPHFLLLSEATRQQSQGRWRFVLQALDGSEHLEAADAEQEMPRERLELLAVVRGLEALPGPSRVTLVTHSPYIQRGLASGLPDWRASGWQWERFGEMVPIQNRDLWQRVDRALEFHKVECRTWRFDKPHAAPTTDQAESPSARPNRPAKPAPRETYRAKSRRQNRRWKRQVLAVRRRIREGWQGMFLRAGQLGTRLIQPPWLDQ